MAQGGDGGDRKGCSGALVPGAACIHPLHQLGVGIGDEMVAIATDNFVTTTNEHMVADCDSSCNFHLSEYRSDPGGAYGIQGKGYL